MKYNIPNACAEISEILNNIEKKTYDKISLNLIRFISNNKNNEYVFKLDYSKNLLEQNLLPETKIILGIIYRDYICSVEERAELIEIESKILNELEKANREKYSPDNLFKNKKTFETEVNLVPKEEETFFTKIKKFFKKMFVKK